MRKEKVFGFFQFIIDAGVVVSSYYIPVYAKELIGKSYNPSNLAAINTILPYLLIVFLFLFFIYGMYKTEELDFYEILLGIIFSTVILAIFAAIFSFWLRAFAVPRSIILYSFVIQILLLPTVHYLMYRLYFKITPPLKMLVISSSEDSAEKIKKYINIIKGNRVQLQKLVLPDISADTDALKSKLNDFEIFVATDDFDLKSKANLAKFFASKNKPLYVVPDVYELMLLNSESHVVGEKILLKVAANNVSWIDRFAKRVLDIVVAIVALVLFSPVILIVSLLILFDDGRPIFYLQDRAGFNGKVFKTIKFRTMIKDAEKETGAVLSTENDPRVTRIGKFLRKTGLDEVPQFINVLRGEMSVVGPRPERPELIEKIKKDVPDFELRLKVKPGITGFAQLAGRYDTPFDEKLKMDLIYAKQKVLFFTDIYVILNTVKLFFLPKKRK